MKYKYSLTQSSRFDKEVARAKKRGLNTRELDAVVKKLRKGERLEQSRKDHALHGEYKGYREYHIYSDWLLVYRRYEDKLIMFLYRAGTHSELF